jgi:hypothetical protein
LADDGRPIATFVVSSFDGNHWYGGSRKQTDNAAFATQRTVIETLLGIGFRVVVKEHPGTPGSPLEEWAGTLDSAGMITVIREPKFLDLIHLGDITVLEGAWTTLVQAVFGTARVYVLDDPIFQWEPGVREHLQAGGIRVVRLEDFETVVGADRTAGRAGPVLYEPWVREPLTASTGDKTSAQLAADAIVEISLRERRAPRH